MQAADRSIAMDAQGESNPGLAKPRKFFVANAATGVIAELLQGFPFYTVLDCVCSSVLYRLSLVAGET